MKILKINLLCVCMLLSAFTIAQNVKLETYKLGEGLNFYTKKGHEVKIKGFIQSYIENKHYTGITNNKNANRFRMRRLRLRLRGNSANERFSYRFSLDLGGASETDNLKNNYLLDAFISYRITRRFKVYFGQRLTYTDNRELLMPSNSLQLIERSRLTSAFGSIREFGLFFQGRIKMGRAGDLKPYFVITNGDGINAFNKDHGGLKIGGRLDYLPFGLFVYSGQFRGTDIIRELTPKLVVGIHASKNNGMSSRRGRESGSILYLDANNKESLPDYTKYGIDFLFKYKGFSVLGEYIKSAATVPTNITQRIRNNGTISSKFNVNGKQDVNNYVRTRMMLGQGYNIQLGYLLKSGFSFDARYTHLKGDKYSYLNNTSSYNRPNYYTIGVSKYLARNYGAKIQASWTLVDGSKGIKHNNGSSIFGNEQIARIMLTLAF